MEGAADVLTLNVAGKLMQVRRRTLQFVPGSALARLPVYNSVFIDRPFDAFAWVVDWCRACGNREPPAHDRAMVANIMHEADYWGLQPLHEHCKELLTAPRLIKAMLELSSGKRMLDEFLQRKTTQPVHACRLTQDTCIIYS